MLAASGALWWRLRRDPTLPPRARTGSAALLALLLVQATLGIATWLRVGPVGLASLHHSLAVVVFAPALNVAQALR